MTWRSLCHGHDSNATSFWCHREWRVVMSRQAVDVVLTLPPKVSKVAEAVAKQSAWLRATSVPLRSIVIKPASHDRGNHYQKLAKRAATKLTVSTYMLAASQHTLEVMPQLVHVCKAFRPETVSLSTCNTCANGLSPPVAALCTAMLAFNMMYNAAAYAGGLWPVRTEGAAARDNARVVFPASLPQFVRDGGAPARQGVPLSYRWDLLSTWSEATDC